jgi:hypothetical protein
LKTGESPSLRVLFGIPPIKSNKNCPDGDIKGDDGLPFFIYLYIIKLSYIMKNFFSNLFKDDNDINEKTIIGFFAFLFLIIITIAEIIYFYRFGESLITDKVFDMFSILVMSFFGIASVDKYINKKNKSEETNEDRDI